MFVRFCDFPPSLSPSFINRYKFKRACLGERMTAGSIPVDVLKPCIPFRYENLDNINDISILDERRIYPNDEWLSC